MPQCKHDLHGQGRAAVVKVRAALDKERVAEMNRLQLSPHEAAGKYGVTKRTVHRIVSRVEKESSEELAKGRTA